MKNTKPAPRISASSIWKIRLLTPARRVFSVVLAWMATGGLNAFPPAPHHTVFGLVRDEMGNPLSMRGANVLFEPSGSSVAVAEIFPGLGPGINYKLRIPLDAGVTSDVYRPNALRSKSPFKLRVQIGPSVYLPIEMSGDFSEIGDPAKSRRIDLTLGVDSDGDGLPDAWERALKEASGGELEDVDPNEDSDNDGLSNLEEYYAGTYAYDHNDGFSLKRTESDSGVLSMEFMSIRGRTYSLFGSSTLNDWAPVRFHLPQDGDGLPGRDHYLAPDSKVVRFQVRPDGEGPGFRFFKIKAQ